MSSLKICSFRLRYRAISAWSIPNCECCFCISVLTSDWWCCFWWWCFGDCLLLPFMSSWWLWAALASRVVKFSMNVGSLRRQTTISISWSTLYCLRIRSIATRRMPMTFFPWIDTSISPDDVTNQKIKERNKIKSA